MLPPRVLIILVDGVEEIEAVGPANILRHAGIEVTLAGLFGLEPIICSTRTRILPDMLVDEALKDENYDVIVVPGGVTGSDNFAKEPRVGSILRSQLSSGGYVAAICAAPLVLAAHGIAKGATVTSYPSAREQMEQAEYKYSEDRVVVDGKLITSRGPGTTFDFSLKIIEILLGSEEAKKKREMMIV